MTSPGRETPAGLMGPFDPGGMADPVSAGAVVPRTLRVILAVGSVQVAVMAFHLLRSKVTAVVVGPEGVGIISVIDQLVVLVAQVTNFSLPFAAVKLLSRAHSDDRLAFVRGYVALLQALVGVSLLGVGLGAVVVFVAGDIVIPQLAGYMGVVVLALLGIPGANLTSFLTNAMAAARRLRSSAVLGLMSAMALALASGAGILLAGLPGFYAGSVFGGFAVVAGGLFYLHRLERLPLREAGVRVVGELRRYPEVINLAASLYLISFVAPLAFLIARYAVLRRGGAVEAGLLQAAMGPALAVATALRSSNALFLTPAMNRRDEEGAKFRSAMEFQGVLAAAIGVLALPIVLFPDWWLFLLYSSKFVAAAPYVYVFVVAEGLLLLAGVNQALVIGLNRIGTNMVASVAGHAGIVLVSLWLVPRYGIGGVAVAFLVNSLLIFSLTAWRLWVSHRMPVFRAMGWPPFLALLVVGAAGAGSTYFGEETSLLVLAKIGLIALFALIGLRAVWGKVTGATK